MRSIKLHRTWLRAVSHCAESSYAQYHTVRNFPSNLIAWLPPLWYCAELSFGGLILLDMVVPTLAARWIQGETIEYTRGALGCTMYSPACEAGVYLPVPASFSIRNLSYSPSSKPSRTGLLLKVMYTKDPHQIMQIDSLCRSILIPPWESVLQ